MHCRDTKQIRKIVICIVEIIEDTIQERPEEEEEAGDNTEALIDQVEKEVDDDFARLEEDIVQEAEKREGANKENMEEKDNKKEDKDNREDKDANNKHEEQTEDQENAAEDDSTMGENPGKEEENNNNKDDTFLLTGSHIVDNVSTNLKNDVDHNGNMEQYVQS